MSIKNDEIQVFDDDFATPSLDSNDNGFTPMSDSDWAMATADDFRIDSDENYEDYYSNITEKQETNDGIDMNSSYFSYDEDDIGSSNTFDESDFSSYDESEVVEDSLEEQNEENIEDYIDSDNSKTVTKEKEDIDITKFDSDLNEAELLEEYPTEDIKETDINALFGKINENVKEASSIFSKNSEMKRKLDDKFEELKELQQKIEDNRKNSQDEIDSYRESILEKLTSKKNEIEKRLNLLKKLQSEFEKEKMEFENYKKEEVLKIQDVEKEQLAAYEERKEELAKLESKIRKQKDSLDEEKRQMSIDKIQFESDKNELANNLLKFNELVNTFTSGIDGINDEK